MYRDEFWLILAQYSRYLHILKTIAAVIGGKERKERGGCLICSRYCKECGHPFWCVVKNRTDEDG